MGTLVKLVTSDVEQAVERFKLFHERFVTYFRSKTRTMADKGKQYLHGQLITEKKGNMVEFEKIVPEASHQSLNHFVSNSPWGEEPILDKVAEDVSDRIGDEEDGSIHIDGSGFPKQGKNSVGVARQYCGRLGKVANCQVGVFLGYTHNSHRILLDKRLYLPETWAKDMARREKCGVPEKIEFRTKAQLGLEMIRRAQEREVPYGWIGMDSHYGRQPWLLKELEDDKEIYIADVPCDTRVWLERPEVGIPPRKGDRGRKPTKVRVLDGSPSPIKVEDLFDQLPESKWETIYVRDTERGELWTRITCLRVYPVRDELPGPETWLILREDEDKHKYQFSNAPKDTSFNRLAQMSHSRYWIERAIEDAKGEAGMDEYQLRGWRGWHHHMTMTILAMLFLLVLQLDWKKKAPMLTLRDVREILEVILPRKDISSSEILKLIERKHKARNSARLSHHRRQKT